MKYNANELDYIRKGIANKNEAIYAELKAKFEEMLEVETDFIKQFPETAAFLDKLSELYSQVGELAAEIEYVNGYHAGLKHLLDTVCREI